MEHIANATVWGILLICITIYKLKTHCNHEYEEVGRKVYKDAPDEIDYICKKCGHHKNVSSW